MNDPFLEKDGEVYINSSGFLPHWNQNGKIQYVTFRLYDSLPQVKIKELTALKTQFQDSHPQPWDETIETEYWKLISPLESKLLDNGYGSCIFKEPENRDILAKCMNYFAGIKYDLIAYVIMPNHIHVLFQLFEDEKIENIMHSIKSFSSKRINKITGRKGTLWMKEYFDRIIRSEMHLNSCISYIQQNPRLLKKGEFEVYINPLFQGTID